MNGFLRALASLSVVGATCLLACSSNTIIHVSPSDDGGAGDDGSASSDDGGGGGGGSGDDSGGGGNGAQCQLPAGTYASHYTSATGTTTCPKPPDSSFVLAASDGGAYDAGPACNVTTDTATCTTTTECTYDTSGYTTKTKSVIVNHGDGTATGTQTTKTTKDADGSVVSDCTYAFTWTKE